jgi:hypothetical protein
VLIAWADEHGSLDAGHEIHHVDIEVAASVVLESEETAAKRWILLSRGVRGHLRECGIRRVVASTVRARSRYFGAATCQERGVLILAMLPAVPMTHAPCAPEWEYSIVQFGVDRLLVCRVRIPKHPHHSLLQPQQRVCSPLWLRARIWVRYEEMRRADPGRIARGGASGGNPAATKPESHERISMEGRSAERATIGRPEG